MDNYISTLETLILTKPNEINSGVMTQPFHEAIKGDPTSINTAPVKKKERTRKIEDRIFEIIQLEENKEHS